MKQKKCGNDNLIHREAVEELLINAHEQGFKEAINRLKIRLKNVNNKFILLRVEI